MAQNKAHRHRHSISSERIGTFFDKNAKDYRPDRKLQKSEPICDMCGAKTSMLRNHANGKVCWLCKASTVKD